jgi:hypothetical protein
VHDLDVSAVVPQGDRINRIRFTRSICTHAFLLHLHRVVIERFLLPSVMAHFAAERFDAAGDGFAGATFLTPLAVMKAGPRLVGSGSMLGPPGKSSGVPFNVGAGSTPALPCPMLSALQPVVTNRFVNGQPSQRGLASSRLSKSSS